jgi:hypothetical protein
MSIIRVWAVPSAHLKKDGFYLQPAHSRPRPNLSRMNTYIKCAANPCGMRTYKIIGLKASCNEHLQKTRGRGSLIVTQRPPTASAHSFSQQATTVFRVTSELFVRSFAKERKSTPLLSCACARFCGYVGVRESAYCYTTCLLLSIRHTRRQALLRRLELVYKLCQPLDWEE